MIRYPYKPVSDVFSSIATPRVNNGELLLTLGYMYVYTSCMHSISNMSLIYFICNAYHTPACIHKNACIQCARTLTDLFIPLQMDKIYHI